MNNLSLGITIGATVSGSVARAFETLDQRATRLGRTLQQVRLGRVAGTAAGDDVANLIRQEERLAGSLQRTNTLRANRSRRSELGGQMMGTAGLAIGAAFALSEPIKEAMAFESTMADIRKVVDMTDSELKTMGKTIVDMTATMPMAASGIGAIVAAAGQSGIAKEELIGFTQAAVKMGVAFDMSGEDAGQMMASFRACMAISQPEVEALADAINYLDTNMNASAKNISDVVRRQGAVAKAAGLSSVQIAALSAALLNSGAQSDVAATALKNLTNALTQGGSATKAQNKVFEQLGMTSEAVTSQMQKDAEGTIKSVFAALAKAPAEMRGQLVGDLFGEEAKGAIMPLLVNIEALDKAFNSVADATKYAGSMQAEYDIRSKTTANNTQLLSNKFDALKINIGAALLPTLNSVFGVIGDLGMKMGSFAENFPRVTGAIIGLTLGLIGLKLAFLGGSFLATFASDIVILGKSLAGGFLAGGLKAIALAQWAFNASLFGCPIVWIIAGIAALGAAVYLVYKNWEPITVFFKTMWADFLSGAQSAGSAIGAAFSSMAATVQGIWQSLINWLSEKFAQIGAMANQVVSTAQTIGGLIKSAGKFMTTPIIGAGKGAVLGATMATAAVMPAAATPLPPMASPKGPYVTNQPITNTFHITQKAGEDEKALAERIAGHIERKNSKDKRGAYSGST